MVRGAILVEQVAQVAVSREVVAVGEGAQGERVPCPRGDQPAVFRVGGQRVRDQRTGVFGVSAGGFDGGGDKGVRGGGDVSLRASGGGQPQRVIPPAAVEVGPAEGGERAAVGLEIILFGTQQADRLGGPVEQPGGGTRVAARDSVARLPGPAADGQPTPGPSR